MKKQSLYRGHRFPAAIISQAVRWYFRFQLSLRDIEELLFERGVVVSHETIRRWCDKFGAGFGHRVKADRRKPGGTWYLDEMEVSLRDGPYLLWRAVDQHGVELDVLLQKRRNKAAAKRFFQRWLRTCPAPRKIVTDQLRSYPAAKTDIPELSNVKHVFVKAAARVNNCAENSHQPTRERKPRMRGFRLASRTQEFLSRFGLIRQHFALERRLLGASLYRKQLAAQFETWRRITEIVPNLSAVC
ncbi:transposase [Burkholderia ubonensis]|uniref:IS6 family transposase n=1 Tax=Burkholderia ubonensis TaxID=101571 RepID=UPI00075D985E|nr:IS6 family transposase [Burkholderia ubonensis]KVR26717.1 transposase [Burkholderia ubonensis]